MNTIDVISLFSQAALEVNGKKLEQVTRDTPLSKLGLDSITRMELVSTFEEKLGIRLPDEALATVQTVGDLGSLVKSVAPAGTEVRF